MSDASVPADATAAMYYPQYARVSASKDRSQLALTFSAADQKPVTIVLPLLGAAGMNRRLSQTLYMLGVRPKPAEAAAPEGEPAASDVLAS